MSSYIKEKAMFLYRWDIKNNNKVFNYGKNHQHLYNITKIYRARDKEMEKRRINKKTKKDR